MGPYAYKLILIWAALILSVNCEKSSFEKSAETFLSEIDGQEVPAVPSKNDGHEHNHHQHHSMGGHGPDGHMMKMWFHGGYDEVILFEFWRTDSFFGMLLSCAAIFIMGATYEGVKWFRVFLQISQTTSAIIANRSCVEIALQTRSSSHHPVSRNASNSNSKMLSNQQSEPFLATTVVSKSVSPFAPQRLIQGLLYIFQLVLAYWLMLVVMTYNTYLTAAVVFGAGFGHWLFAVLQLRNIDAETTDSFQTDACH